MNTVDQVLKDLKKCATEQTRKTYLRHGAPVDAYGVSIADLKTIARRIKGNQSLACALYETGNFDAMYLAGMVADGSQMSKQQLESWARNATCSMISEYAVAWAAAENPASRELAMKWIGSKRESIATSGWCTYAGIIATTADEKLDLAEIKSLLGHVIDRIHTAPNLIRYAMNGFVIAVGSYVEPLLQEAKRAAKAIGTVSVDMGDTACKVPLASEYIAKAEADGRIGNKRKTMKC